MNSLIACARDSSKENRPNEDCCVLVENNKLKFSGIIVADGLGSHSYADLAADFCANQLKKLLECIDSLDDLKFAELYEKVKEDLHVYADENEAIDLTELDVNKVLGTTLICVLDIGTEYWIAYVGNGSIWHIDGGFNQFNSSFYLPWNSINLLNPHTVEEGGKAALYKLLSISEYSCKPTVLKLSKNNSNAGDIMLITTDGVYSEDARIVAKDQEETIWIKGEESMVLLYEKLSLFLCDNPIQLTNEDLENSLQEYLTKLREKGEMHDDTTLGVMISAKAIEYHQAIFLAIQEKANGNNNQ